MNSHYLSFPELPDGYMWRYDGANEYKKDVDMFIEKLGKCTLCAWVHARYPHPPEVHERNDKQHTFSFCMRVDSIQDGIDLLAARCWLGLTGVPDA